MSEFPPHVRDFANALSQSWLSGLGEAIGELTRTDGEAYLVEFERHLALLRGAFPGKAFPDWAVGGLVSMNMDILREEVAFRKKGAYAATAGDLASVRETVYDNAEVMDGYYLVGLFCTYFVWPHHWEMLRFYREKFLSPGGQVSTFAEFGVGHGLLSCYALERWPAAAASLLDLSPYSLEFSRNLLNAAGMLDRCSLRKADVLEEPELPHADRLVCSELLEHVPEPRRLLERIARSLNPSGRTFLTGAVTAAQADHVYLFEEPEEVLEMVSAAGLRVLDSVTLVHPKRAGEDRAPRVVAVIAERNGNQG